MRASWEVRSLTAESCEIIQDCSLRCRCECTVPHRVHSTSSFPPSFPPMRGVVLYQPSFLETSHRRAIERPALASPNRSPRSTMQSKSSTDAETEHVIKGSSRRRPRAERSISYIKHDSTKREFPFSLPFQTRSSQDHTSITKSRVPRAGDQRSPLFLPPSLRRGNQPSLRMEGSISVPLRHERNRIPQLEIPFRPLRMRHY